ncbi:Hypothetical protein BCD_1100 (plasmid) [Borrelia crocidurae DOU]|uniref:Uncharacterized protein n=1 Tax=Borrelia crocidurae DOU TaxID=1293575 RepID=W5SPY8_9SPIR|nr:hypothetical protein [Borrelia crocidurae]AHH07166.1 Hypothetical protein BCD_1100 [Borrelia crocidurae DOU]
MSTIKNVNKLFDAVVAKDSLLSELDGFIGESNTNLVREGMKFTSNILSFIYYIKNEIAKINEDKRAFEIFNSKLRGALDVAIDACRAIEDGENWDEYDKLIELRGQIASEILQKFKSED